MENAQAHETNDASADAEHDDQADAWDNLCALYHAAPAVNPPRDNVIPIRSVIGGFTMGPEPAPRPTAEDEERARIDHPEKWAEWVEAIRSAVGSAPDDIARAWISLLDRDGNPLPPVVEIAPKAAPTSSTARANRYVHREDFDAVEEAAKGQECQVLSAIGITWTGNSTHTDCPYPSHGGKNDWRWDDAASKAFCTCKSGLGIISVVMKTRGGTYGTAALFVAETLHLDRFIHTSHGRTTSGQRQDPASLLNIRAENRDDALVFAYLGSRCGVSRDLVPRPWTRVAGIKALDYFDKPAKDGEEFVLVGKPPCAVFEMIDRDDKRHAHRIYLSPDWTGKADLGIDAAGNQRDAKKLCSSPKTENISGRSVAWGNTGTATTGLTSEGIETATAIAIAFRDEIDRGEVAVFACITAGGVEAFKPYAAMKTVIVCADRDEKAKRKGGKATRRGDVAARKFGSAHQDKIEVKVALPGQPGTATDWLDVLVSDGIDAVRSGILAAEMFKPTPGEPPKADKDSLRERIAKAEADYPLMPMHGVQFKYADVDQEGILLHHATKFEDGEPSWEATGSPVAIAARTRMIDEDDAYGLRIVVEGMNGERRAFDVSRGALAKMAGNEIRSMLLSHGWRPTRDGEAVIIQAMKSVMPPAEIATVSRRGWHQINMLDDPIFAAPDGQIMGDCGDITIELSPDARLTESAARRGTMDGWRAAVEVVARQEGVPHWTLGVLAGLVGPLVYLARVDTYGINLSGFTSAGKTTAQKLAVSAWSTPDPRRGLLRTFSATANSFEVFAQDASGTILAIDEAGTANGKELASLIYSIAGNVGKSRLSQDAELKQKRSWSTFALLSGEHSLADKVQRDGGTWQAGMAARFPDVDVSDVNRHVPEQEINLIKAGIDANYGHAGTAFAAALIEGGFHRDPDKVRRLVDSDARRIAGEDADSSLIRSAYPFALLHVAGMIAKHAGILPRELDIDGAIKWAWTKFGGSTDARALNPEHQVVETLQGAILSNWDVDIRSTGRVERDTNRAAIGWYDGDAVYIKADEIVRLAGGNLKQQNIGAILEKRDLLARREDDEHRTVKRVPGVGSVRCYALKRPDFGRSDASHHRYSA